MDHAVVTYPCRAALVVAALLCWMAAPARATFNGFCSDCHTMHNSQDGVTITDWSAGEWDPAGPGGPAFLLAASCVGCHTGTNTASSVALTNGTDAPYVMGNVAPTYNNTGTGASSNTLAGGNFWWTTTNDRAGHNVAGIAATDGTLGTTPPGGTIMAKQLRCSGLYGCHGDRTLADPYLAMEGSHHEKTRTANYRILENTDGSTTAIGGLEDGDWEFQATDGTTSHNQYKGVDRTSDTDEDPSTMSSFCASCHGDFHNGAGTAGVADTSWGSPWIRHPVDYELPNSGDYASYNTDNSYSVIAPVASSDVSSALSAVTPGTGDTAIVMCLSCHRAHGTPYDAALRWDYKSWPGGGYNGCAICHTSKD